MLVYKDQLVKLTPDVKSDSYEARIKAPYKSYLLSIKVCSSIASQASSLALDDTLEEDDNSTLTIGQPFLENGQLCQGPISLKPSTRHSFLTFFAIIGTGCFIFPGEECTFLLSNFIFSLLN